MATSEVSLHCVICFEEFDLRDRTPVVLPCGHTYVCIVCAKRLKKCMECREPLFWNPPRPPINHLHPHLGSHAVGTGRYSRHPRQQHQHPHRYLPGNNAQSTPPHPGSGRGISGQEKKEEVALPLPKNVVLMEMIEAKERQERLIMEAKKKRQELQKERREEKLGRLRREEQYSISNEKEVTLGEDQQQQQNELAAAVPTTVPTSSESNLMDDEEETEDDDTCDDDEEVSLSLPLGDPSLNCGYAALSGTCGTYAVKDPTGLVVLSHDPNRQHYQQKHDVNNKEADDDEKKEQERSPLDSSLLMHDDQPRREPFTLEEGQKVQVVGVDEQGVYQLARGAGFIVATVNQLVKVGGPLETSCKLEGMLKSVLEKQQEVQRKLIEINNLAIGLREKIILEQEQPEEVPVISQPKKGSEILVDGQLVVTGNINDNNNNINASSSLPVIVQDGSHPSTPTRAFKVSHTNSPVGASGGVESITSVNSTVVELGAPMTPGPPVQTPGSFLEMDGNMYGNQYVHSPAHSCPMLDQRFLDDSPAGAGVLRYRVNSDDDMHGMGWAGIMGCGSSLFGERLIESSRIETRNNNLFNTASNGHDILALSYDGNSIMEHSNSRQRPRAAADAQSTRMGVVESSGSADSPLRRGGSFDGVNFRTGMSGHRGLGQPKRERQNTESTGNNNVTPQRVVRMMSQHRGAAAARGKRGVQLQRRSAPADTLVGCQTIR